MKRIYQACGLVLLMVLGLVAAAYFRKGEPECNCFFPNTGKYGVMGGGGKCVPTACVPPRKKQAAGN